MTHARSFALFCGAAAVAVVAPGALAQPFHQVVGTPGVNDVFYGVWPTRDGGSIAVGEVTRPGLALPDWWIVRFRANGDIAWDLVWGIDGVAERAFNVVELPDGAFVVVGESAGAAPVNVGVLRVSPAGLPLAGRLLEGDLSVEDTIHFPSSRPAVDVAVTFAEQTGRLVVVARQFPAVAVPTLAGTVAVLDPALTVLSNFRLPVGIAGAGLLPASFTDVDVAPEAPSQVVISGTVNLGPAGAPDLDVLHVRWDYIAGAPVSAGAAGRPGLPDYGDAVVASRAQQATSVTAGRVVVPGPAGPIEQTQLIRWTAASSPVGGVGVVTLLPDAELVPAYASLNELRPDGRLVLAATRQPLGAGPDRAALMLANPALDALGIRQYLAPSVGQDSGLFTPPLRDGFIGVGTTTNAAFGIVPADGLHLVTNATLETGCADEPTPSQRVSVDLRRTQLSVGRVALASTIWQAPFFRDLTRQRFVCRQRPCVVDYNNDGELTFDDIQIFVALYNAQNPLADLNNDGEWTFDDIQLFVVLFNAGC